jgi:hypothetical protein
LAELGGLICRVLAKLVKQARSPFEKYKRGENCRRGYKNVRA